MRERGQLVAFNARAGDQLRAAGRPPGRAAQRRATGRRARQRRRRVPSFVGGRFRDATGRLWQELRLSELARHDAFLRDRRLSRTGAHRAMHEASMSLLNTIKGWGKGRRHGARQAATAARLAVRRGRLRARRQGIPRRAALQPDAGRRSTAATVARIASARGPSRRSSPRPCRRDIGDLSEPTAAPAATPAVGSAAADRRGCRSRAAAAHPRRLSCCRHRRPAADDLRVAQLGRPQRAQVAASGQALMQSQRLAKAVSQALVGSPKAFPEVRDSSEVLSRTVLGLQPATPQIAAAPPPVQEAARAADAAGRTRRQERRRRAGAAEGADPGRPGAARDQSPVVRTARDGRGGGRRSSCSRTPRAAELSAARPAGDADAAHRQERQRVPDDGGRQPAGGVPARQGPRTPSARSARACSMAAPSCACRRRATRRPASGWPR